MEIPAWAETLFEKVVVVFETPAAGTPLEHVGSMDLLPWIDSLLVEVPAFITCMKTGIYPASFLTNVLGVAPDRVDKLPGLLTFFLLVYLLCGALTMVLRFRQDQTSLLPVSRQICNAILCGCVFVFVPMLKMVSQTGFGSSFYPLLALLLVLFSVCIPLDSVLRYVWVYQLTGIPHAIFDVGFGPFVLAVQILCAYKGSRLLTVFVFLAVVAHLLLHLDNYTMKRLYGIYEQLVGSGKPVRRERRQENQHTTRH